MARSPVAAIFSPPPPALRGAGWAVRRGDTFPGLVEDILDPVHLDSVSVASLYAMQRIIKESESGSLAATPAQVMSVLARELDRNPKAAEMTPHDREEALATARLVGDRRLEAEALHTAAATLPPAIAVNAIELWTVEGSSARNSSPTPTPTDISITCSTSP